uniref:Uncharacterized protein n=1 Tax=Heterorhabditis bacteriophora TaxID=37862 RepID=A0A1I7WTV1_HETBA
MYNREVLAFFLLLINIYFLTNESTILFMHNVEFNHKSILSTPFKRIRNSLVSIDQFNSINTRYYFNLNGQVHVFSGLIQEFLFKTFIYTFSFFTICVLYWLISSLRTTRNDICNISV